MITLPQNEEVVIDGSESYITGQFLDINGNPYVPTSLQYRIDDLTNQVPVLPWTVIGVQGTSILQPITAIQNTMNAASVGIERRQVLIQVGIPGGTLQNADVTYLLLRRTGTP